MFCIFFPVVIRFCPVAIRFCSVVSHGKQKADYIRSDLLFILGFLSHWLSFYSLLVLCTLSPTATLWCCYFSLKLNLVLSLEVPDDVIIDRIKGRWTHLASGRIYHTEFNPPKVPVSPHSLPLLFLMGNLIENYFLTTLNAG